MPWHTSGARAAPPVKSCIRTLLAPRGELVGLVIEQARHNQEEHLLAFEEAQRGKLLGTLRSNSLTPALKSTHFLHSAGRRPIFRLAQVEIGLSMGFPHPLRQRHPAAFGPRARYPAQLRWDAPGADPMIRMKDPPFTKEECPRHRLCGVRGCPEDGALPLAQISARACPVARFGTLESHG